MLTPVEMQGRELKQGRGYQKKDADAFLSEVYHDFESLYRENMELKDKVATLSDGLKYYKDLEKTLQKTLVVAEKTAEETTKVANKQASVIIADATVQANQIVQEANTYFEKAKGNIKMLMQEYESYRIQCRKLAAANLDLLNSDAFKVNFETVGLNMPEFVLASQKEEIVSSEKVNDITMEEAKNEKAIIKEKKIEDEPVKLEEQKKETNDASREKENKQMNAKNELDSELFEFFNLNDE